LTPKAARERRGRTAEGAAGRHKNWGDGHDKIFVSPRGTFSHLQVSSWLIWQRGVGCEMG
jgi:hypothetical protein